MAELNSRQQEQLRIIDEILTLAEPVFAKEEDELKRLLSTSVDKLDVDDLYAAANYGSATAASIVKFSGTSFARLHPAIPDYESNKEAVIIAQEIFEERAEHEKPVYDSELVDSIRVIEGALAVAKMMMADPTEHYKAVPITHKMWQSPYDPQTA